MATLVKTLIMICIVQVFGQSLRKKNAQKVVSKNLVSKVPKAKIIAERATYAEIKNGTQDHVTSYLSQLNGVHKNTTCPEHCWQQTVLKCFAFIQFFLST